MLHTQYYKYFGFESDPTHTTFKYITVSLRYRVWKRVQRLLDSYSFRTKCHYPRIRMWNAWGRALGLRTWRIGCTNILRWCAIGGIVWRRDTDILVAPNLWTSANTVWFNAFLYTLRALYHSYLSLLNRGCMLLIRTWYHGWTVSAATFSYYVLCSKLDQIEWLGYWHPGLSRVLERSTHSSRWPLIEYGNSLQWRWSSSSVCQNSHLPRGTMCQIRLRALSCL